MSRYWVIAPYGAKWGEIWEEVWRYDLEKGVISIGWGELGDIASLSWDQLLKLFRRTWPGASEAGAKICCGMLSKFYHEVKRGDKVIARHGLKKIAAIGTVKHGAYYDTKKHTKPYDPSDTFWSHLDVEWQAEPRDKDLAEDQQFGMNTIYEVDEEKYILLLGEREPKVGPGGEDVQDQDEFVLEKYLEDFIVTNFDVIFKKKLVLVPEGQQYQTKVGIIDILAQDPRHNDAFVVIELKKGRGADQVVGQIMRYMGWVAENLCSEGQEVHGVIICKDYDDKLRLALKMARNVSVKCYRIDFTLQDQPEHRK